MAFGSYFGSYLEGFLFSLWPAAGGVGLIAGWDGPTGGTGLLQQGKQFKQVDGGSIDTGSVDAFRTMNSADVIPS